MYEITLDYLGMTLNKTTGAVLKSGTSKVAPVALIPTPPQYRIGILYIVQNCTVQEI